MKNELPSGMMTFAELENALNQIPDQVDGDPCSISDIGELYVEFLAAHVARVGDEKIVERYVVADMTKQLSKYFERKSGRIYWRIRLETEIKPHDVVLRMDAKGDDIDFITNQRCIKDKNWVSIRAYCRLVRATMPTIIQEFKSTKAA